MTRHLRLLIVEDSEDDAVLMERSLVRAGFAVHARRVETERDLRAALAEEPWDCAISDYRLPAFDGLTALRILLEEDPNLPAIIVSGKIGEEQAVAAMRAGARDYVMKDNLARLGEAVRRELEEAGVRRERAAAVEALRASEARFRSIVEDQTDFLVRWRADGARTFVNRAFCDYLGRSADDIVGTAFLSDVAERDRQGVADVVALLSPDEPVVTTEPRMVRGDGGECWTEWVNRGLFDAAGRLVEIQSVGRDTTGRRRAAEAEHQQRLLVEVLRDTAEALNSTLDLDALSSRILAAIAWVIPHDAAVIFSFEGETQQAVRHQVRADGSALTVPAEVRLSPEQTTAILEMVREGRTALVADVTADHRLLPLPAGLEWVRGLALAPLYDEGRILGLLALLWERPATFTESHRQLLEGFASQAASAARNARLFRVVSHSRAQLRSLAASLVNAQEDERRRISRELHDEVGQALTGVILNADFVRDQLGDDCPPWLGERIAEVSSLARTILEQVRGLCMRLRPAMLDELGLVSTLRWYTDAFSARSGIETILKVGDIDDARLDPVEATTLYRCVQEALTNAARHAGATTVAVELGASAESVRLAVSDDGAGFDSRALNGSIHEVAGLGLTGMRERVAALGGRLDVWSTPGRGTLVVAELPLGPAEAGADAGGVEASEPRPEA